MESNASVDDETKEKVKRCYSLLHFIRKILCAFMNLGKLPVLGHVPYEDKRSNL